MFQSVSQHHFVITSLEREDVRIRNPVICAGFHSADVELGRLAIDPTGEVAAEHDPTGQVASVYLRG